MGSFDGDRLTSENLSEANLMLHVGVIGAGIMGRRHAENIAALAPRAKLMAIADMNPEAARTIARALNCDWYQDPNELLKRTDIHAMVVVTPADTHASLTIAAAERGKDVLCEKPLALSVAEARTVVSAADRAGIRLQVGFMRRYDPAYREAYEAIERGDIGKPVLFAGISRDAQPPPRTYFSARGAGDIFMDSGIHDFDLARWLMHDEVVTVSATGALVACHDLADVQPIDVGLVTLRYHNGAVGTVQLYRNAIYGYDIRTEVVGTEGTLLIGDTHWHPLQILRHNGIMHTMPDHWLKRFSDAYAIEIADWVDRMSTDREPAITGEDGIQAVALAEAAQRSCNTEAPVQVRSE